jgi:hypothetical protein
MAEMSWRNTMRRLAGSLTNAASNIVNTARSAVNRKLSSKNEVGSSATARYRARDEDVTFNELQSIYESSDDESHPQAGLPASHLQVDLPTSKRKRKRQRRRPTKFTVETTTALNGVTMIKHIIPKKATVTDEATFLNDAKRLVCGIFKQNRNTKVKLELTCQDGSYEYGDRCR